MSFRKFPGTFRLRVAELRLRYHPGGKAVAFLDIAQWNKRRRPMRARMNAEIALTAW
jgi:hypothetical protein